MHDQKARIEARHHSHSHPGEPRTGMIRRLELQQGTTATHRLKSQEQVWSAGYNCSKAPHPLTDWRAKDRHDQQVRIPARHHSHSPTGEPRTGMISRLDFQQGTTATNQLVSQGQAWSAGQNCSKVPQSLTSWRAKDMHDQQARISARNQATHILSGQRQEWSAG